MKTEEDYNKSSDVFKKKLMEVINRINCQDENCSHSGISSGFKILDRYVGGFSGGSLNLIASRPSFGKTALAISLAVNMAFGENPVHVGFFSLEIGLRPLIERFFSNMSHVDLMRLRDGEIKEDEKLRILDTMVRIQALSDNIMVINSPGIGLNELRLKIMRVVKEKETRAVFVDGLDLVENVGSSIPRWMMVNEIARTLKILAQDLEIPIFCLCPIAREEGRERPPMLADLKDLGFIEQYADLVILIDSPGMRSGFELDDSTDINIRNIIIAKNRNGRTGEFAMRLNPGYCRFEEI